MNLKLIMALVADEKTEDVLDAARKAGATGATVITSARGEGLAKATTFLGLELTSQRDLLLFLVAAPLSRDILDTVSKIGRFDEEPGTGIAFQVAIEDAVGLKSQQNALIKEIEDSL